MFTNNNIEGQGQRDRGQVYYNPFLYFYSLYSYSNELAVLNSADMITILTVNSALVVLF